MLQGKTYGFFYELEKNKLLYLMFLPVAIFFIVFAYFPMAGIIIAFKSYNFKDGILLSPWNGFENFKYFFASGKALLVTRNTVAYNLIFLACYNIFSLIAGISLAQIAGRFFRKVSQTIIFLPYFISWVTVAAFIYNIFGYEYGLLNSFLRSLGHEGIDIYSNPEIWWIILPFLYVWKSIGFGSVLYLAAIISIDQECYESAMLDGANAFQKIRHITIPLLKPTMVILILLGIGRIMRGEFDMFYQLVGNMGTLFDYTDIIDTLVFRSLITVNDFGMASASGFYQSVLCFVIITAVNFAIRMYDKDYALF